VLKTCRLSALKLGSNTVPKSTVFGAREIETGDAGETIEPEESH
jgi:hypothetical protein